MIRFLAPVCPCVFAVFLWALSAEAQEAAAPPVEIVADGALEWLREEQLYVARGNALATRGSLSVRADRLTASTRDGADGQLVITRLGAEGNVRLSDPPLSARGGQGVYDLDEGVAVLSGTGLAMSTAEGELTARDSIEYFEREALLVARGEVRVEEPDGRSLRADVVTARLDASGRITRIDALGNVEIRSGADRILSEEAIYDVVTGRAEALGDVRILQGANVLTGERADFQFETGTARVFGESGRARALVVPGSGDGSAP